ncbi:hypothetical protein [Curtobacterium sp. MCSS17_016]|uniref:hypothetical protein n=1 Tax=Curtobacterium sp. MCSS17_016 TaxID=2175644 RepID=UPI000DA77925|nr:hypothetical protein [Curtobacterium sp. MCSS17_016]WIE80843.1 hypothetical protein DEJ19_020215 [Curtobacterium sp. MCSS17_016]
MTATTTAERYYVTYDRGTEDTTAHSDAVRQVVADIIGADNAVQHGAVIAVIATDTFPATGANPNYARALDDIFDLRRAAAYEARVLEAHYEGMKSFPKTRLRIAEESVARLRNLARGGYHDEQDNIGTVPSSDGWFKLNRMKQSYLALGLDETLTNYAYEQERPLLVESNDVRANRIAEALVEEGLSAEDARTAAERIVALPESKPSRAYSEAITELYSLRGWFAIEALLIDEHLAMKSFPKSRRKYAEDQRDRLAALAAGKRVHYGVNRHSLDGALRQAGAEPTLSRAAWESHVAEGSWGWMAED